VRDCVAAPSSGGIAGLDRKRFWKTQFLWPGAEIASKSHLEGCIVRSGKKASGSHRNIDI
jgi:hypothetical protein